MKSCQNCTDSLTRLPERWLDLHKRGEPMLESYTVVTSQLRKSQVAYIHQKSGYPGIKRTLYFARIINLTVSKELIKSVVTAYESSQSIDPAHVHWEKRGSECEGKLEQVDNGITHYDRHFLMLIDCDPSCFTIWQPLQWQDSISIIRQQEAIFYEWGPPAEILTDNDTMFTCRQFKEFTSSWGVHLRFPVSSCNSWECSHRSIKTITARKNCPVLEAVYWYNVTPKDNLSASTLPDDMLHRYHIWVRDIDATPLPEAQITGGRYEKGDVVEVKTPHGRYTTKFGTGPVTEVISQ